MFCWETLDLGTKIRIFVPSSGTSVSPAGAKAAVSTWFCSPETGIAQLSDEMWRVCNAQSQGNPAQCSSRPFWASCPAGTTLQAPVGRQVPAKAREIQGNINPCLGVPTTEQTLESPGKQVQYGNFSHTYTRQAWHLKSKSKTTQLPLTTVQEEERNWETSWGTDITAGKGQESATPQTFIPPDYCASPVIFFCFSRDNHLCGFQYFRDLTLQSFLKGIHVTTRCNKLKTKRKFQ